MFKRVLKFTIVSLVFIFIAAALVGCGSDPEELKVYDSSTTLSKLESEFNANEVGASEKYEDKRLWVRAQVISIDKSFTGSPYVVLHVPNDFSGVQASFDSSAESLLAQLNKGQVVDLVCGVGHYVMGNVTLDDCVFK